jgi:hypothetical protein
MMNAALQLVGLELHHGDGGLHGMARRHPLHDCGEDAADATVRVPPGLVLHLPY